MNTDIIWAICYVIIIFAFTLYLVYKMVTNNTYLCGRRRPAQVEAPVEDISSWSTFQVDSPYGTSMKQSPPTERMLVAANHDRTSEVPDHLEAPSNGVIHAQCGSIERQNTATIPSATPNLLLGVGASDVVGTQHERLKAQSNDPNSRTTNLRELSSSQLVQVAIEDDDDEQPVRPPSEMRVQEGKFAFCDMAATHAKMSLSWQPTTAASPPPLENGKTSKLHIRSNSSRLRLTRLGSNISNRSRGNSTTGNILNAHSPQQEIALKLLHESDKNTFIPTVSAQRLSLDNIVMQNNTDGSKAPVQIEKFTV
eukprot:m.364953 g.364953  ORF g.364953 m.364953 type:complete len:310 (-) comp20808_c1_seq1:124-1053(-)